MTVHGPCSSLRKWRVAVACGSGTWQLRVAVACDTWLLSCSTRMPICMSSWYHAGLPAPHKEPLLDHNENRARERGVDALGTMEPGGEGGALRLIVLRIEPQPAGTGTRTKVKRRPTTEGMYGWVFDRDRQGQPPMGDQAFYATHHWKSQRRDWPSLPVADGGAGLARHSTIEKTGRRQWAG